MGAVGGVRYGSNLEKERANSQDAEKSKTGPEPESRIHLNIQKGQK